jgi:hypothetical protein
MQEITCISLSVAKHGSWERCRPSTPDHTLDEKIHAIFAFRCHLHQISFILLSGNHVHLAVGRKAWLLGKVPSSHTKSRIKSQNTCDVSISLSPISNLMHLAVWKSRASCILRGFWERCLANSETSWPYGFISQIVFIQWFCKVNSPTKF